MSGPALASARSPILSALLDACRKDKDPLHFVSWHIYTNDPARVRESIVYVQELAKKRPRLKPETILDEWNMNLTNPPLDPRFQPCYIRLRPDPPAVWKETNPQLRLKLEPYAVHSWSLE